MEPITFVLFGATGDLAKRKIYPALYNLFVERKLPPSFSLVGLGRRELTDQSFRANVERAVQDFSRRRVEQPEVMKDFLSLFRYCALDVGRKEDYRKLREMIERRETELGITPNRLFYLSVGPELFETIAAGIQDSGLGSANGWKRLVIEKPFGRDLQSARDLNRKLSEAFAEHEIYRIDHYLGKPMVQKLEVLQQNPVLQALWTNHYIANVQITASETVGVEERAGYYDHSGAIRDMFQNHMLQLLMMLASHLPQGSTSEMVRFKKKKVMEALEPLQKEQVSADVVRGQYVAGTVQGKPVAGYTSEPGIPGDSMTDTFIAARLRIDDFFWRGVPFYIRTGKRMKEKSTRIVIEFKEPVKLHSGAGDDSKAPNLLVFEIGPSEGISLQLNTKAPGHRGDFKPIRIDFHENRDDVPEAYENLIFDALHGDPTFFAHWDEVELSWKWVQPILDAFEENLAALHPYAAGTYGPAESDALLAEDGYRWWFDARDEQKIENEEGELYACNNKH
ncbi:glucose-6-phosphate dehydrogenase [Paenibacillus hamazuiensis]|uniref:glucose-6-phosphate dehydrogenase n=1 Tax=Paenibacillus hamazuiensis TaxID=2936508 RepID=UPI00200E5712|nr:glucose-6-phosphate dehydrogenase [Paenibacillus hamazuiensis]